MASGRQPILAMSRMGVTLRDIGLSLGCRKSGFSYWDIARDLASSAHRCGARSLGSLPRSVPPDCAVHGRPCDAEQVADLCGAVLARLQQRDQVRFLARG